MTPQQFTEYLDREISWNTKFRFSKVSDIRKVLFEEVKQKYASIEQPDPWISTTERLPEKPGKRNYEHVYCLVYYKDEIRTLPWNCEHLCWDEEDGDDYECDPTTVTHWMPLPAPPSSVNQKS